MEETILIMIIPGGTETDVRKPPGFQNSPTSLFTTVPRISPPPVPRRRPGDDVRASSLSILAASPSRFSESKSVHNHVSIVDATEYYRSLEQLASVSTH